MGAGVQQSGREYYKPSSSELGNVWGYTSTSPYALVKLYLIKYSENFYTAASTESTPLIKTPCSLSHAVTSKTYVQRVKPNTKVHCRVRKALSQLPILVF
jgi:hypothetical protein